MPLSAAEKQRRYREKRDKEPERRGKFLQEQRKRYDKDIGKRKVVSEMTSRENRCQRRYWKEKQNISRQKRKAVANTIGLTPPHSPVNDMQAGPSRQIVQVKRQRSRENSKLNREKSMLLSKLKLAERRAQMYRKRWQRLNDSKTPYTDNSPRTKTDTLLRFYSKSVVRKTLDFHHILLAQLRDNCKQRRNRRTA